VEEIQAYIAQVTQRSMVLWLQGLKDRFADANLDNPNARRRHVLLLHIESG
jgi:hypothetical protein